LDRTWRNSSNLWKWTSTQPPQISVLVNISTSFIELDSFSNIN
jgi:hypothetical protein